MIILSKYLGILKKNTRTGKLFTEELLDQRHELVSLNQDKRKKNQPPTLVEIVKGPGEVARLAQSAGSALYMRI